MMHWHAETGTVPGGRWTSLEWWGAPYSDDHAPVIHKALVMEDDGQLNLYANGVPMGAAEALEVADELIAYALARIVPDTADAVRAYRDAHRGAYIRRLPNHTLKPTDD